MLSRTKGYRHALTFARFWVVYTFRLLDITNELCSDQSESSSSSSECSEMWGFLYNGHRYIYNHTQWWRIFRWWRETLVAEVQGMSTAGPNKVNGDSSAMESSSIV